MTCTREYNTIMKDYAYQGVGFFYRWNTVNLLRTVATATLCELVLPVNEPLAVFPCQSCCSLCGGCFVGRSRIVFFPDCLEINHPN